MGRFKRDSELEAKSNPIIEFLLENGFEKRTGAKGQKGYTKVYSKSIYYTWVTINLTNKIVDVYEEYDCGGMTGEAEYNISNEAIEDLNIFIDEIDDCLEGWIGED